MRTFKIGDLVRLESYSAIATKSNYFGFDKWEYGLYEVKDIKDEYIIISKTEEDSFMKFRVNPYEIYIDKLEDRNNRINNILK